MFDRREPEPEPDDVGREPLHPLDAGRQALGSIPNAVEAMQRGAFGYLTKPFDDKELKETIDKALSQRRMSREIDRLKSLVKELYGLENVVARSSAMQQLFQQIGQVAESDATILLFGETGTGKEVMARGIHANSRRSKGAFVALNCAAIPETLFESELFGHVKGAFTSAHGAKRGLFQMAHGGTLFLDEIGEMPLSMQVKLLRAVQEREIREVGSETSVKVDVRFIAATNKDLGEAVGFSFPWASCMEARACRADDAYNYLDIYVNAFTSRNGFNLNGDQSGKGYSALTYRPFTLEANFGASQAVHEMLLQSWGGKIRIFPAVPSRWEDVSFRDLRAEGGFIISAERKAGKTTMLRIKAVVDGKLMLKDPFEGKKVTWNRKNVRKSGEYYECTLKAGEELRSLN